MRLLNYLDRKFEFSKQKNYLFGYLFFGYPFSYMLIHAILYIWIEKDTLFIDMVYDFIRNFIFNILIVSPLIINYFRYKKKYNHIVNKIHENYLNGNFCVKAKFDFKEFKKNQSYPLDYYTLKRISKKTPIFVLTNGAYNRTYLLKNYINKFELDDIKEERLKKLKKLKKKF